MPRYLVERTFPQVHSYFTPDRTKSDGFHLWNGR